MLDDPLFLVAINLLVAFFIRTMLPNMASSVLMAVVLVVSTGYLGSQHGSDVLLTAYRARDNLMSLYGNTPHWPPEKLRTYPDLQLIDQEGRLTRLSSLKGKVLLIQPVGMPSRASVALAGGHLHGPFDDVAPQPNLEQIEVYAEQFGKVKLRHPDLVRVHLILFNKEMMAPRLTDIQQWAQHFQLHRSEGHLVLAASLEMATFESHAMVPGFQLVDKRLVLRADATGAQPQDSLYTDLLPMIGQLLNEG